MTHIRHKIVNGICYLTKIEETHLQRCEKHSPTVKPKVEVLDKKKFIKMNGNDLPVFKDEIE